MKQSKMEDSGFDTFYRKKVRPRNRKFEADNSAERDFEIPEFELEEYPVNQGRKALEEVGRRVHRHFYNGDETSVINTRKVENGLHIDFDNGRSIVWMMNGDFYIGDYNGVLGKNGKGFEFKSGKYKYHGQFRDGKKHGRGLIKTIEGYEYEGEWFESYRNGYGREVDPVGNVYKGSWEYNQYHGQGFQQLVNGETYEGEFYQNKRHGWGVWKSSQGEEVVEKGGG